MNLADQMEARVKSKIQAFEQKLKNNSENFYRKARETEQRLQELSRGVSSTAVYYPDWMNRTAGISTFGHHTIFANSYNPGYHNSKL